MARSVLYDAIPSLGSKIDSTTWPSYTIGREDVSFTFSKEHCTPTNRLLDDFERALRTHLKHMKPEESPHRLLIRVRGTSPDAENILASVEKLAEKLKFEEINSVQTQ